MLLVLRVYMIDFYKSPVCCKEGRGNYDTKFEPWTEFYPATIFVYKTIFFPLFYLFGLGLVLVIPCSGWYYKSIVMYYELHIKTQFQVDSH